MIDKDIQREMMLQCTQENALRGTKLYSLLDGRLLRYDGEIVGELESLGGCHGINKNETACKCGWLPQDPTIKVQGYHPDLGQKDLAQ